MSCLKYPLISFLEQLFTKMAKNVDAFYRTGNYLYFLRSGLIDPWDIEEGSHVSLV